MIKEQIIALGGGGFSMEESPALDQYILESVKNPNPKICFLGTASGDSEGYINRFYKRFGQDNCQPTHLELFRRDTRSIYQFLENQDIIYVGGGNTANMLTIWKLHGVDRALKNALSKGTVLCGLSAGSICWFEEGVTDSFGKNLAPYKCLGLLPGSNCPHYDGEKERRPSYHKLIHDGLISQGVAADDGVALHYINGQLHNIVSSRESAGAYKVEIIDGKVQESKMATHFLSKG